MKAIDAADRKILRILQENARTPNVEIARRLHLAPSAVLERIRKLEKRGAIRGYEAQLDAPMLDLGLVAFVFVRAEERVGSTTVGELLARVPGVQEVHHVAGEDCYLVKVRASGTEGLGKLLREQFGAIRAITSTRTTVVFTTVKETAKLPIEDASHG
jgi:Lrp/AsnC family transcriptional regulator, leucine-responsive regulatory protein